MNYKFGKWAKDNWFFSALVVMFFAAAIVERGPTKGAWIAGMVCYAVAVASFCSLTIVDLALRTRPSWEEWSLLAFAAAFAMLAYALDVPELAKIGGLIGLAGGVVMGLLYLFYAWRLRAR